VQVPLANRFGKDTRNYQIISVPYQLAKERIDELFSFMGKYDETKWRFVRYEDGKNLDYEENSLKTSSVVRGQSYWFISKSEVELKFGSGSTFANTVETPFFLPLKKGWNQIGNPFPYTLNWSEVLSENEISPISMPFLIYDYENKNLKRDNTLQVFSGGFVFADNDMTLKFPTTLSKQTNGRISNFDEPDDLNGWLISLQINQGPIQNSLPAFGMRDDANKGKDKFDLVVPPAFFEYLNFGASNSEYEYKLTKDIVPFSKSYTWNYELTGNLNGPVEIKWSNEKVKLIQGHLYLHDLTNHSVIDMASTNNYVLPSSGASIKFYFTSAPLTTETNILIGQSHPNPFSTRVIIPFDFSPIDDFSGNAMLSIYDLQGKKIFETEKVSSGSGVHHIEWEGIDGAGAQVPEGMYIYKLINKSNNCTQFYQGKIIRQ
jgi:hypothetical protein